MSSDYDILLCLMDMGSGSEYDVLEDLLGRGEQERFEHIQVQFHETGQVREHSQPPTDEDKENFRVTSSMWNKRPCKHLDIRDLSLAYVPVYIASLIRKTCSCRPHWRLLLAAFVSLDCRPQALRCILRMIVSCFAT